jgi:hypothetical protein
MGKAARIPVCKTCGGTGTIWSMRSWFTHDGYYSLKCGYCDGTGRSRARFSVEYEKRQRIARERIASDRRWRSKLGANEIGKEAGIPYYQGVPPAAKE